MKLQQKAMLGVLGVLIVMIVVVSGVLLGVVGKSFARLEIDQARARLAGVQRGVAQELDGLASTVRDYAEWVDTSQFIDDRNPGYMPDNYTAQSLENIRVDHVLLFAPGGEFIEGRTLTPDRRNVGATAASLTTLFQPMVAELTKQGDAAKGISTVIRGPRGLALAAVVPVVAMESAVYPGGFLVFMRSLDGEVNARMAQLQGVPVTITAEHEAESIQREQAGEWHEDAGSTGFSVRADSLLAHFPLRDWQGSEVGWVHVELPRDVYLIGRQMSGWLVAVVVLTGLILAGVLMLILRRLVIKRLQTTCEELATIEARATPEGRLTLEGSDELTRLGASINTMLDALANAQAEREKREHERRSLEAQLLHAQKLEMVGTFAGGIAHDFNNYLATIQGWVDLAQASARSGEIRPDYLDHAKSAIQRGSSLVRQLLLFSRGEQGEPVQLKLGAFVRESVHLLGVALPKEVRIDVHVETDDFVRIDPGQFQQVLLNLVTNASAAMKHEGLITIEVKAVQLPQAGAPGSAALKAGPCVWMKVADTGAGILPEVIPHIFEPFFTTKPVGEGTGLGLAVVHRIVEAAGAAIHVESKVGAGTAFHFYFPAMGQVEAPAPEATQPQPAPKPAQAKGSILLVDDDRMVREMWEAVLTQRGYEVISAEDGVRAWDLIQGQPLRFDMVLTDHVMPHMNGLELATRTLQTYPTMPVVLLTAVLPANFDHLTGRGLFEVVSKPVAIDRLVETVGRAILRNPARN